MARYFFRTYYQDAAGQWHPYSQKPKCWRQACADAIYAAYAHDPETQSTFKWVWGQDRPKAPDFALSYGRVAIAAAGVEPDFGPDTWLHTAIEKYFSKY